METFINHLKNTLSEGKDEAVLSMLKSSLKEKKDLASFNELVVLERKSF